MRHLDLSFEGKYLAEKNQLDNGKLPHGGYRGSKRHPPSHLSYDKGREFQHRLEEELSHIMEVDDLSKHGGSPAWSILVHNSPSYTDESPLITNNLLAASKLAQINGINIYNRQSLLPNKPTLPLKHEGGTSYYRPNRMHQYLSATELKNSASQDVNIKYGRPTRTTLLRARQRSNSAPSNVLEKKRDFAQRLDEVKTAPAGTTPSTEYLKLQSVRDGESLHSYLTGARYNRAHCLDSKSVDHNGVYMPRHNPALGSFFTGPKGQEYLQEFGDSPRGDLPSPASPRSPKRRPLTAPSYGRRPVLAPRPPSPLKPDQPGSSKYKYLKLNIVGSRLPIGNTREPIQPGLRLPRLTEADNLSDKRLEDALDQTYLVNQPMPSPVGVGEASLFSKRSGRVDAEQFAKDYRAVEMEFGKLQRETDISGMGPMCIEGRSTWKVKAADVSQNEGGHSFSVPTVVEEERFGVEERSEDKEKEGEDENNKEEAEAEEGAASEKEGDGNLEEEETLEAAAEETQEVEETEHAEQVVEEHHEQAEEEVEEAEDTKVDSGKVDEEEEPEIAIDEEENEEIKEEKQQEEEVIEEGELRQEEEEEQEVLEDQAEINEEVEPREEIEEIAPSEDKDGAAADETEVAEEAEEVAEQAEEEAEQAEEVAEQKGVRFFLTEDGGGNVETSEKEGATAVETTSDTEDPDIGFD